MVTEIETDDGDTAIDEGSLSIAGGFGKFVLGGNDGASDNYGIDAQDVVSEDINATGTDTLALLDTDVKCDGDSNKISYHLPAIGGLMLVFHLLIVDLTQQQELKTQHLLVHNIQWLLVLL